MDRFTPTRPSRPSTRTRHRPRHMSPSPRPLSRRPFTEPSTLFITTDYDFISPSSMESDLIFHMSPVHTHFFPPPPPNGEPINVMTLRNKPETKPKPPPLSPLLYSFPRPPRLHPYMNKNASTRKDIVSKPLSSISQNTGVPTIIDPRAPPTSTAVPASDLRPLISSFIAVSPPPRRLDTPSTAATTATTKRRDARSPHSAYSSSPIPIPRHIPRQSDLGYFDLNPSSPVAGHPVSIEVTGMLDFQGTPYASSGIASHASTTGFADTAHSMSPAASPDRRRAAVTDFDDGDDDGSARSDGSVGGSMGGFSLSGNAYSSAGSGPFRLARFLEPETTESNSSSTRTSSTSGPSAAVLLKRIAAQKRMS
ncbi:hypothetical protein BU17DRAFT_101021 [Hysterangium stoloniferum]|nr:hypothetical protein BU17DRAFT_101021 [Hysterangium stoloniferum]